MSDLSVLSGKTLAGDGGEGMPIQSIVFKFDSTKDGKEIVSVELGAVAKTVLNSAYNPNDGYADLPEPVPVTQRIVVSVDEDDKANNTISFNQLNKAFDLSDDPLVDRLGEDERFLKDGERSVYDKIYGKPAYFSAKLANGKTGEKASDYYFNIVGMAKRVEATRDEVAKRIAAIREKRKAEKEAKAKVMEGMDAGGVPF